MGILKRIYVTYNSTLNLNPNKINNIIALAQNDGAKSEILRTKRWQNRKYLEVLERYQDAPALSNISVTNITLENPAKCDGYAFALLESKICLVQFLAMYHKLSNYHFYTDSTNCINLLSYISICVYIEQISNIFRWFPINELKYVLFSHISSYLIIYYLSSCENFTENMGYLIVGKKEIAIYNFFKLIIDKLQLIIATKLTNGNAE
ncbi:hypothetical protein C1645_836782 [Glomus cerebriforme]|uniref:Uncharacterized protein n=1 Tax=Glomus cerebriforme TaxID=658196 RepID=A0A397SBB9_9GLOM|nr:hypothetical protein C1645_836782 [Glomus cerebriforme]